MCPNPWDEKYSQQDFFYGKEPNTFLVDNKERFFKGARVLCLGEGEGRNAVFLASLGAEVTAVDGSSRGLDKVKMLAHEKNVTVKTIHADLNDYTIEPLSWDFIVSIWCHLPGELRQKVFASSEAGLVSGGFFVLEAYTPHQLQFNSGGPKDIDLLMSKEKILRELSKLEIIKLEELERDVHEGIGHKGMSAVVQVIARKA